MRRRMLFGNSSCTYTLRRASRSRTITDRSRNMTESWAFQTMQTRIWLSWIKYRKTAGPRRRCAWAHPFWRSCTYPLRRTSPSKWNNDWSRSMTKPWAGQTMETRIWLSWVNTEKRQGQEEGVRGRMLFSNSSCTYRLKRASRSWTSTDKSGNITEPWACQAMETRIWLSSVEYRKTTRSKMRWKCSSWANAFWQQQLYLHPEKSIEIMNKYRSIKKYDRVVSVLNDGNEHMIIVSQIQKNDRFRKVWTCFSVAHP